MSALTPRALADFRKLLRGRVSSMQKLADEIGTTRSYLSRVIWNDVESVDTRKRLHACTTAQEWALLCTLEHFATWNTAQSTAEASAAPGEYHWFMRQECAHCHGDRRFVPCCRPQARQITHGLCPACLTKHYPAFAAEVQPKANAAAA